MQCLKCQKEIDNDSKFCEFCSAKIENTKKIVNNTSPNFKEANNDLANLKSKPLYRFLKVAYLIGFCASILYILFNIGLPQKVFDNNNLFINCNDYRNPKEKISNPKWSSQYRWNADINKHNKIVDDCYEKSFYINLDFSFIVRYILTSLFLVFIFESIRQAGYYIFIGKFYPHKYISKMFKKT
jgi:hypothetical protein